MRVCPKCGHVDPPEWRHMRWSYWIDFCTMEDFQRLKPILAERLNNGEKLVEDEYYVYRLSRSHVVHRKALVDYGPQFSIPMESYKQKGNATDLRKCWDRDPNQKKLLETTIDE